MSTNFVQTGFWVDYSRPLPSRCQILLSDYWAGILTNTIAVLITSTSTPIFQLLRGPVELVWKKTTSRWNLGKSTSLNRARDLNELAIQMTEVISQRLQTLPRGEWENVPLEDPTPAKKQSAAVAAAHALGAGSMFVIVAGLPVALLIASIVSAGLAMDTIATSKAPKCGIYEYNSTPWNSSIFLEFEHRAESQSGVYAEECYGTSPLISDCNKFYNQTISYSVNKTSKCPYDGNVCDGVDDSIELTTGMVPASVLGINTANPPPLFSRTMICSPLVSGPEYVSIGVSDQGDKQWEYWYGRSLANYTWANPVEESAWEIKGYSTGVHCSEPGAADANFVPLPEFRAGPYPVTAIFINSHTILYPQFRDDPVFPARQEEQLPPEYPGPTLYYNNSTQAGILGCVDRYRICKAVDGPCWDNGNTTSLVFDDPLLEKVTEEQNSLLLLLLALDSSTACGSVQFRGAEALDAHSKIAHMLSLPLAEKQWQVEAEKMFQTSLARIQLNVFDIVQGTASSFDGYEDDLPKKFRGICQLVKIPTVGWRNINFAGVVGVILTVIFVWGISRKRKTGSREKRLVAVLLWEAIRGAVLWIAAGVKLLAKKTGPPLWHCLETYIFEPSRRVRIARAEGAVALP